jgi:hypothetical protein
MNNPPKIPPLSLKCVMDQVSMRVMSQKWKQVFLSLWVEAFH